MDRYITNVKKGVATCYICSDNFCVSRGKGNSMEEGVPWRLERLAPSR